jgi:hypothetical protein
MERTNCGLRISQARDVFRGACCYWKSAEKEMSYSWNIRNLTVLAASRNYSLLEEKEFIRIS